MPQFISEHNGVVDIMGWGYILAQPKLQCLTLKKQMLVYVGTYLGYTYQCRMQGQPLKKPKFITMYPFQRCTIVFHAQKFFLTSIFGYY